MKTTFLLAACLLCWVASAQPERPDFSGTWKLDNNKSTQDGPADRVYTVVIAQTPKTITVTTKAEGVTNLLNGAFPIDNKFHIEKIDKLYRYTKVYWENGTLILELLDKDGKKEFSKVLMGIRESWTMSPSGNVLTTFRQTGTAAAPGHPTDKKYVFSKQ